MSRLGCTVEVIGNWTFTGSAKLLQVPGLHCHGHTSPGLSIKRMCSTLGCFGYDLMCIFQHVGEKSRNDNTVDTGFKIELGTEIALLAKFNKT